MSDEECPTQFRDIVEPENWHPWIECPHEEHWASVTEEGGWLDWGDEPAECRMYQLGCYCALDEGHGNLHRFEMLPGKAIEVGTDGIPKEAVRA